jgi:hypothetical protein
MSGKVRRVNTFSRHTIEMQEKSHLRVARVFQGCYKSGTGVLKECHKSVARVYRSAAGTCGRAAVSGMRLRNTGQRRRARGAAGVSDDNWGRWWP